MNHPQVAIFARLAKENTPYIRSIEGQKTLLGRTMHDFSYDPIHDEIVITSALAQAILTFRGAANGEEPPIRIIQGDKTGILAVGALDKVTIDPVHEEYFITTPNQEVLVFSRLAQGNVAPIRVLKGPDTQLAVGQQKDGIFTGKGGNPNIRVDPIHNLLLVPAATYTNTSSTRGERKVLVFDRTATGNTKPRAIIHAGNIGALYAPKRRLVTHNRETLEVWDIPDSGEAMKPIVSIPCPLEARADGGVMDLDPAHKEVIIATGAGNTVSTYYVPEVFD